MATNEYRAVNLEVPRKPGNRPQRIDITLDVSVSVLTTLQDVAEISPVPFLSNAASTALSIVNVVQRMRSNKKEFRELAKDSCEIVCEIIHAQEVVSQTGDVPIDLVNHLEQLVKVLCSIEEFARKGVSRNFLFAMLRSNADARQIQDYQKKLHQALGVFGLKSNIILRNTVAHLAANQAVITNQLSIIARVLALPPCARPSLQFLTDILRGAPNDISRVVNIETLFHLDNILSIDNYSVISTQIKDIRDTVNLALFVAHVRRVKLLVWSRLKDGDRKAQRLFVILKSRPLIYCNLCGSSI